MDDKGARLEWKWREYFTRNAVLQGMQDERMGKLKDFQISIGHVGFYESLVLEAGLDDETEEKLRLLIHNHNTFGVEKLLSQLSMDSRIRSIQSP